MPGPDHNSRHNHLLYHMSVPPGTVLSSRDVHWLDVNIDELESIEIKFKYHTYIIAKNTLPGTFLEFVHFRSAGTEMTFDPGAGLYAPKQVATWTVGWTDGTTEYLTEYDYILGTLMRAYTQPRLATNPTHFHPRSRGAEANKVRQRARQLGQDTRSGRPWLDPQVITPGGNN